MRGHQRVVVHAVAVTATLDASLREGDRREWQRHPVDVARLTVRLVLLDVVLGMTAAFPSALTNVSTDLVELFARMPTPLRYLLVGVAQLTILAVPVVTVVWLATRRTRAATLLVVGAGVASGLVMLWLTDWLNRAAPPSAIADLPSGSFIASDFPSIAYLAALVAGTTAASPLMPAPWRKVGVGCGGGHGVRPGGHGDAGAGEHPGHPRRRQRRRLGGAASRSGHRNGARARRRCETGLAAAGFEVDELGDEHEGRQAA